MMPRTLLTLLMTLAFACSVNAGDSADPSSPIRAKTQLVLADLSAHQSRADASSDAAIASLRSSLGNLLAPIIDMDSAAKLLLGRQWQKATPPQRARFKTALNAMLMTTYTQTLAQAEGIKIGEIIQKHPEESVAIVRNWLYQDA